MTTNTPAPETTSGIVEREPYAPYAKAVYDTIRMSDLKPIRFGQKLENLEFFVADFLKAMDEANINNPHRMDNDTTLKLIDKHFSLHVMFLINKLEKNPAMEKFFTKVWWNGASDFQRVREIHKHIRIKLLSAMKNGLHRANAPVSN